MSSKLQTRLQRLEAQLGTGQETATARVHFGRPRACRRAIGNERVAYDLMVPADSPVTRLHVLATTPTPEADRRPGEPTARRAAIIRARLLPLLDGRQRGMVRAARFVVVMP